MVVIATLLAPASALAQSPAQANDGSSAAAIAVEPSFASDTWIESTTAFDLTFVPAPSRAAGTPAVMIDETDWTTLFEPTPSGLRFRPRVVPLPRGEHTLVVYLVTPEQEWREIGRVALRVLGAAGFEKAEARPTISATSNGQIARGAFPDEPSRGRDAFQDLTLNAGVESTLVRRGWTTRLQSNFVAVTEQSEALRFGVEGAQAPRLDLADYGFGVDNDRVSLRLGHVMFGSSRHLVNGFASRGATATFKPGPVVDFSFAAMNGSSIVGFSNFFGLGRRNHRVLSGTVGAELVPARPGAVRLSATVIDGSVLPIAGFNEGSVNDAETSRGISFNLTVADARQRIRVDAGYARSRFDNPVDPLLAQDVALVPVEAATRGARYLDASVAIVQGASIARRHQANVTVAFRHERVDPLFRSVAAALQADVATNAVETSAGIGPVASQLSYSWSQDNLAGLSSLLTTRTRTATWSSSVPIAPLANPEAPAPWLPALTYTLNRVHQFGDGLPVGGGFDSLSQVPDQISFNQSAGALWQAAHWRAGYQYNRSLQDNRQPGRELADLLNLAHTASLGVMAPPSVDVGVELAWEGAENRELVERDVTHRWSVVATAQPARRTTLSGMLVQTLSRNRLETRRRRNTDMHVQFARSVALAPRHPDSLQGQLFVRLARQTFFTFDSVFGPAPQEQRVWTATTGLTLRVF